MFLSVIVIERSRLEGLPYHNWKMQFNYIMAIVLSVIYGLIALAFIPLFLVVIKELKYAFPDLYEERKCRLSMMFLFFIVITLFRLAAYLCIQFETFQWLSIEDPRDEVPFYISELLLCVGYSILLIKAFGTNPSQMREPTEDSLQ